ncbi:hypothetical protein HPB47_001004, partial [Ixodes persulcatus]
MSTTIPCIDARLLHMWEARRSLLKRLKRQRWNQGSGIRHLAMQIKLAIPLRRLERNAEHDQDVEAIALPHQPTQWQNGIPPQLGPTRYFPTQPSEPLPPYTGSPNDLLDEDIHLHEVSAALQRLKRHTTPGMDQITNKALINLDSPSLLELTAHLNKHIVLNRLQPYLEDSDKLPTTSVGFRPRLSTQDILLQIKEEVMAPATRNSPTALLTLDLKGAFDNVKHSAILQRLNTLGCGARTYHYIRDFLSDRKAILKKSELLLVSPQKQHPPGSPTITIHLEGHTITPSRSVKILGMIFQADRNNSILVKRLQTTIDQVTHMIRRIATKTRGMGEKDTLRLVQAFVVSRITYAIPYALLNPTEVKTLDTMIRKANKQAMGLPTSTSTERLLRLGVHNTAEDLIEAHLSNQQARLGVTETGRSILSRLGLSAPLHHPPPQTASLPHVIRSNIIVPPLPRNMHPVHHAQRREARARAIHKQYGCKPSTAYTDAASYPGRAATTATVIMNNEPRSSISLPRNHPLQAEEAAIALALTQTEAKVIVTDSQQAYRNFASGHIHAYTLRLINQNPPTRQVRIVWAPAHQGIPGNEIANLVARDLTRRADAEEAEPERMHPLVSYLEITQHYRLTRRTYPPPHKSLPSEQERILRALQVNTFPHPTRNHLLAPTDFSPQCRFCGKPGSLRHMVGGCSQTPQDPPILYPTTELWARALASSDLDDQLRL